VVGSGSDPKCPKSIKLEQWVVWYMIKDAHGTLKREVRNVKGY
jgi:hypothetical protein